MKPGSQLYRCYFRLNLHSSRSSACIARCFPSSLFSSIVLAPSPRTMIPICLSPYTLPAWSSAPTNTYRLFSSAGLSTGRSTLCKADGHNHPAHLFILRIHLRIREIVHKVQIPDLNIHVDLFPEFPSQSLFTRYPVPISRYYLAQLGPSCL